MVDKGDGLLILDDTTLDKPYANEIEHVTWHWSGKHEEVVKGINLLTLLWRGSSGGVFFPGVSFGRRRFGGRTGAARALRLSALRERRKNEERALP